MTAVHESETQAQSSTTRAEAAYGAMPDTAGSNFYLADPNLRLALSRYLSDAELAHAERILTEAGEVAAGELDALAMVADKHPPELEQFDKRGERVDRVVHHPAYEAMERIAFGRFDLNAVSHRDGVLGWPGRMPAVMKYALSYVLVQAEFGLFCPVNMTDSLARVLMLFADDALKREFLPHLTTTEMDELWQGAQFLTEKEGGSDVGASRTVARREDGGWRLYGDKWFCSNAGAEVMLTLARPEGAPDGTRGLGLFLVPARLPDGSRNRFRINRLKDKLGSRSMASGEYTFDGAVAYQVGPLERGFRQMMEMVNASRLSNAMRAAAMMRRSFYEALVHARGRMAFGRPLAGLPLMREKLIELMLDSEAAVAVVLQAGAALGRADAGSADDRALIRILMPLAKWYLCKRARYVTGEGMEVRGGNGYVEDWVNPRLVRDSHLGSIWEGASNVILLDVARAMARERAHETLFDDVRRRLDGLSDPALRRAADMIAGSLDRLSSQVERLADVDERYRDLPLDGLVRRMYHLNAATLLLEEADRQAAEGWATESCCSPPAISAPSSTRRPTMSWRHPTRPRSTGSTRWSITATCRPRRRSNCWDSKQKWRRERHPRAPLALAPVVLRCVADRTLSAAPHRRRTVSTGRTTGLLRPPVYLYGSAPPPPAQPADGASCVRVFLTELLPARLTTAASPFRNAALGQRCVPHCRRVSRCWAGWRSFIAGSADMQYLAYRE